MAAAAAGVLVLGTGVLDGDRQPPVATLSPPAAPPEVQPLARRAPRPAAR